MRVGVEAGAGARTREREREKDTVQGSLNFLSTSEGWIFESLKLTVDKQEKRHTHLVRANAWEPHKTEDSKA